MSEQTFSLKEVMLLREALELAKAGLRFAPFKHLPNRGIAKCQHCGISECCAPAHRDNCAYQKAVDAIDRLLP